MRGGIEPTDRQRVLRALELLEAGHEPPPPAHAASELWTTRTRHPTLLAALTMERDALTARSVGCRVRVVHSSLAAWAGGGGSWPASISSSARSTR